MWRLSIQTQKTYRVASTDWYIVSVNMFNNSRYYSIQWVKLTRWVWSQLLLFFPSRSLIWDCESSRVVYGRGFLNFSRDAKLCEERSTAAAMVGSSGPCPSTLLTGGSAYFSFFHISVRPYRFSKLSSNDLYHGSPPNCFSQPYSGYLLDAQLATF